MSADLATLFTGRYIEIHVFPFSFQEYCQYYDDISDKDKLFDEYAIKGGLAGSYAYRTEKDRTNYIKEVYETIVTRDLVQKYTLPDTLVLQRLSEFLMDNISNLTSPNKVSKLLTANETPTNHVTVGKYIKYLCNAFVFYDIKRYDIRGKKYLESSEKFYLCDSGIRYAILGSRNMDYGRVYENIVCIELLRRGYDVYVGKLYQKEKRSSRFISFISYPLIDFARLVSRAAISGFPSTFISISASTPSGTLIILLLLLFCVPDAP